MPTLYYGDNTIQVMFRGYVQHIPDNTPESIRTGVATIMCDVWYQQGEDVVAMMRRNARPILIEIDQTADENAIDDLITFAREYRKD